MAEYTVTQAASILGISRQSVYKYLKRDRDRYVSRPDSAQTTINDQGIERLREDMGKQSVSVDRQVDTGRITDLEREIERLRAKIESLTVQHDADQRLILVLQQTVESTQKALDQEQQLRLHELVKPSWLRRLFGQTENKGK